MSIHCNLCGLDFEPDCAETGCQGCPLKQNCRHITCPRCGYLILPEAALLRWLRQAIQFLNSKKTRLKERS